MENARFVKVKLIFIKDIVLSVEMVWFMIQKLRNVSVQKEL